MFLSASVTFLLSLTLTFLTPAVHAQEIEPTGNFLLRVTRGRATDAPRLNNIYVSLTSTGQAIINTTTPATPYYGFPVRLNPGPEYGKVYERGTGRRGYLKPKATGSPHYEFFWKKTVPTVSPEIY